MEGEVATGARRTLTVRHVALLRGINVGGNKKVPMAALREVVEALGHTDVRTHLQSGNVVFDADPAIGAPGLALGIEDALRREVGVDSRVLVRTADELRRIVERNPLADAVADPSRFHVVFLEEEPDAARLDALLSDDHGADVVRPGERALYVWYRDGVHTSKLAKTLDRRVGVAATARNWNTVTKVLELLDP